MIEKSSFIVCLLLSFRYLEKHQPVLDELKDVQPPRDPEKVWELLCAHPVHVFQLVRRLKFFEEKINPLLTSESECMYIWFLLFFHSKIIIPNIYVCFLLENLLEIDHIKENDFIVFISHFKLFMYSKF